MADGDSVSHRDIYHKLGILEGKFDSVLLQLGERRDDMAGVFTRLRSVEFRVAVGVGIAIGASVIIPLLFNAANPRVSIGQENVRIEGR